MFVKKKMLFNQYFNREHNKVEWFRDFYLGLLQDKEKFTNKISVSLLSLPRYAVKTSDLFNITLNDVMNDFNNAAHKLHDDNFLIDPLLV